MKRHRITYQSHKPFENTEEYKRARRKLVKEINNKYQKLLHGKKSFLRRLILRFRKHREIKKRIEELNPLETLYQNH